MDRECMNVVYASNDGYARHLGTSLYSLLDRNRDFAEISVYVLTLGLSEENQGKLRKIAEHFGRRLIFLNLDDLLERIGYEVDTGGFDISVMLRLFMGDMLPESVERVLYLDCDTVVLQSLKHLWKEELEGKIVGAVMEPTIYQAVKESIDLGEDDPYYNSGVLLVDLKQWREQEIQKKLLGFWKSKGGKLFASDQDVINGTLKGQIHTLMPRYNFFTNYRYFQYNTLVQLCDAYRAVGKKEFAAAKRKPVIIHFLGDERPWIRGNHNHYGKWYRKYLAMTPWKDMPTQKGKFWYMQLWWCFNQITRICPAFRLAISRRLGMKVIDDRKKHQGK
jgi:lipopolysaccharide biosynthesis glycosyltransferase